MKNKTRLLLAASLAGLFAAAPAQALDLMPQGISVIGGAGENDARMASVGLVWPWSWQAWGGQLTGYTEGTLSHWSGRDPANVRHSYAQVAAVPMFRWRFDGGRSAWFAEGGIGVSWMDGYYAGRTSPFSTRFNFVDVLGVGRNFGDANRHEVSLRIQHISNAGIKHPNPGENHVQLRYARAF